MLAKVKMSACKPAPLLGSVAAKVITDGGIRFVIDGFAKLIGRNETLIMDI
jgi:hypothetical protein